MSDQAWLESSLRRSSRLGLQVLERAQRRSVDWASTSPSLRPTLVEDATRNQAQLRTSVETRARSTLNEAFDTIVDFMAQTTHQCKNYYASDPELTSSKYEAKHVCRYHSGQLPGASKDTANGNLSRPQKDTTSKEQGRLEDFHIEVCPGTYAVTAGTEDSKRQTHLVRVNAGESVNLTFHL
ncbi:hypothetical protein GJAV_G00233200 [Gymnothorax javanicus]|nr:hypothetical protein GJAV_G00233200 [Gymnothorax javanicus]